MTLYSLFIIFIDLDQALDEVKREMLVLQERVQKSEKKLQVTQSDLDASKASLTQTTEKVCLCKHHTNLCTVCSNGCM